MKKSFLYIKEILQLDMSMEEFKNWQDRNISKKKIVFRTIFFSSNREDKTFFAEQKEETLILRLISRIESRARAQLNFKFLESDQRVVLKTEIQNAWILYVFNLILISIAVLPIVLMNWSRSLFSDEEFIIFTQPLCILIFFFLIMFTIQLGYLRFCVNNLHRKIKESLSRK